jgi:polygalacturonase
MARRPADSSHAPACAPVAPERRLHPHVGRRHFLAGLAAGLGSPLFAGSGREAHGSSEVQAARARATTAMARGAGAGGVFDVRRFGARGDGTTPATRAIQAAIEACHAAGGGVVLVPAGRYLCGALFLRSHVHLHIGAGATLVASKRFEDFPPIDGRWEGIERKTYSSLLTGLELENVTITGAGALDGQGPVWWQAHAATQELRQAAKLRRQDDNPPGAPLRWPRPRLINLIRCERVTIGDLLLNESPAYFIHLTYCHNVKIENISVVALTTNNADGVIVDSSKDVRIADCSIGSGSDCIGIKAGFDEDGRRVGLPAEDIIVTNCHLHSSGGCAIALGSETAGGIRNVTISNCTIVNCTDGLYVKSARGRGGVVEGIRASNLVFGRLQRAALIVGAYFHSVTNDDVGTGTAGDPETDRAARRAVNEGTPTIRDIDIDGVTAMDVNDVVVVEGLPERFVQGVRFQRLVGRRARNGARIARAADVSISGFTMGDPTSPMVIARDIQRLELHRLTCGQPSPKHPVVHLTNVAGALIHGAQIAPGAPRFLAAERSRDVVVTGSQVAPDEGTR